MAAEYSANALQNVAANASVIFSESPVPCNRGLIFHRDESGSFLLANNANSGNNCTCGCGCRRIYETRYQVAFHANISLPTGGTVEPIALAIAIDGEIDPSSVMQITAPLVSDTAGDNVGADIIVSVPSLCRCSNVSVRNISTQPINVQNANIVFDYAGVSRVF